MDLDLNLATFSIYWWI